MSLDLKLLPDSIDKTSFKHEDLSVGIKNVNQLNNDIKPELKNGRFRTDTILRLILSCLFTAIIGTWLGFVIYILCKNNIWFKLSDNVLITLLTTTTIQIIGMMVIILRNLFPNESK